MFVAMKIGNGNSLWHLPQIIDALDEIFEDMFADIVIEENECDGCCCEKCNHRDCLN